MPIRSGSLLTVVLVASALTACDDERTASWGESDSVRYCTDAAGHRVPDQNCQTPRTAGNAFLWYYLGRLGASRAAFVPPLGGVASGGGYAPAPGLAYTSVSGAIARGGFGATGGHHGEGGAGE
jgi:hypothetical protein